VSKAFTKEGDGEEKELPDLPDPLPPGAKNYMTPAGVARLRNELNQLLEQRGASPSRQREIDRRVRYLAKRLDSVEVIDPATQTSDCVVFGATVAVRDSCRGDRVYRIVGVDEVDLQKRFISWISPIGRALIGRREGDSVSIQTPAGEDELEIVAIRFQSFE